MDNITIVEIVPFEFIIEVVAFQDFIVYVPGEVAVGIFDETFDESFE